MSKNSNEMSTAECVEIFEKCVCSDNDNLCTDKDCTSCITSAAEFAASILRKVAAGELVVVVHCGECIHGKDYGSNESVECKYGGQTAKSFYCADGERKEPRP